MVASGKEWSKKSDAQVLSKASWMMVRTGGLCTVSINLFDPRTNTKSVSLGHTTGAGPTTRAGSTTRARSTTRALTEGPTALPPPTSVAAATAPSRFQVIAEIDFSRNLTKSRESKPRLF